MNTPQHHPHPEHATMRMTLDVDRIPGDRVAAIVEEVRRATRDAVTVTGLAFEPVSFELAGAGGALEGLRMLIEEGGLRRALRNWTPVTCVSRSPRPAAPREPRVLVVDGDHARARVSADGLARANLHSCVVGTIETAQIMMRRSELRFDAVVLYHRLADGDGLELLDRVDMKRRRCSVLVIDDESSPRKALAYRQRGVFRYIAPPASPLRLANWVTATMHDTWAWRQAEQSLVEAADEPPRLLVDPQLAADRLQHVCDLSRVERDVAAMVLMGERDLEIAEKIGQSERTAKRHVGRVMEKAGIQNRASLWSVLHVDGMGPAPSMPSKVPPPVEAVEVRTPAAAKVRSRPAPAPAVAMQSSWTAL